MAVRLSRGVIELALASAGALGVIYYVHRTQEIDRVKMRQLVMQDIAMEQQAAAKSASITSATHAKGGNDLRAKSAKT